MIGLSSIIEHREGGPRASADCPHCGDKLKIRSSRPTSPTSRQLNLACQNVDCGATFGAVLDITHEISPSREPNPSIVLRKAPPRAPRAQAVNDTVPSRTSAPGGPEVPPANDDDALTATG